MAGHAIQCSKRKRNNNEKNKIKKQKYKQNKKIKQKIKQNKAKQNKQTNTLVHKALHRNLQMGNTLRLLYWLNSYYFMLDLSYLSIFRCASDSHGKSNGR